MIRGDDDYFSNIQARLEKAIVWLKRSAEDSDQDREVAHAIIALTDAGEDVRSNVLQRLSQKLLNKQIRGGSFKGTWNRELWDTSFALIALYRTRHQTLHQKILLRDALTYILTKYNEVRGNWYDEIWETVGCCRALIEANALEDDLIFKSFCRALDWLATRKCLNGSFVSSHYTSSILSLLCQVSKSTLFLKMANEKLRETIGHAIEDCREWLKKEAETTGLWSTDTWIVALCISALIDSGESVQSKAIRKAVDFLMQTQRESGSWAEWIEATSYVVTSLAKVLGDKYVTSRNKTTGLRIEPTLAQISWRRLNNIPDHILGEFEVVRAGKIAKILPKLERKQVIEDLLQDILVRIDHASLMASLSLARRNGRKFSLPREIEETAIPNTVREMGALLYAFFFGGYTREFVSSKLLEYKIDHMLIDPDSSMIHVPWELLYDDDDFWCIKYAMGRCIPGQLVDRRLRNHNIKMLLIGDPTEDQKLEGVRDELKRIEAGVEDLMEVDKFYGCDPIEGIDRVKFLEIIKNGKYDIIHFAGHAEYIDDRTFLMFGEKTPEGAIRIRKVGAEDLKHILSLSSQPPHLVFINACSSAAFDPIKSKISYDLNFANIASDMVQAFSPYGIGGYVGSMWPIHDKSAGDFAVDFYANLMNGWTLGDSVRLARIENRAQYDEESLTWASFVLYGDPTLRLKLLLADNDEKSL